MIDNKLRHVAIIMDGNNRWAKREGKQGIAGHRVGVERIRDVLSACRKNGVETLTLFAFSSENWRRPPKEVEALMGLFYSYLKKEAKKLAEENEARWKAQEAERKAKEKDGSYYSFFDLKDKNQILQKLELDTAIEQGIKNNRRLVR